MCSSDLLQALDHPVIGRFDHQAPPYHFSQSPPAMRTAPLLGQHTRMICAEILGMSEEEIASLEHERVFD